MNDTNGVPTLYAHTDTYNLIDGQCLNAFVFISLVLAVVEMPCDSNAATKAN